MIKCPLTEYSPDYLEICKEPGVEPKHPHPHRARSRCSLRRHLGVHLPSRRRRLILAKLNRQITLWDIGWTLFHYWEMKVQVDVPEYPTASQLAELDPDTVALVEAFPDVTADEALAAFKALGFSWCRARGNPHLCLDWDVCCPEEPETLTPEQTVTAADSDLLS